MHRAPRRLTFLLASIASLVAIYLGVALFAAARLTAPGPSRPERTPDSVGLAYREVAFESVD